MMKFIIFIVPIMLSSFGSSETLSYDEFREISSIRKRDESADSFEQCAPVNFTMGQLGIVNVLAFLDNSWPYSHKQASMLKLLKDRLEHSDLPEALFFVITSDSLSNRFEHISEEEIEKEAWEGVAPDEAMELSSGLLLRESLEKTISPDIMVIEDTEELGIWRELHGSRDQVLVIDRCGKLAYQVIVPWSILHFPYVKAAILSTHKDDPCGPCDAYANVVELDNVTDDLEKNADVTKTEEVTEMNLEMTTNTPDTNFYDYSLVSEDKDDFVLPSLRIIMHAPHYHLNTDPNKNHEYLVMQLDKPSYHGHLNDPTYEITNTNNEQNSEEKIENTLLNSIVFGKDESPGLYGEVADFWRDDGDTEQEGIAATIPSDLMDQAVTSFVDFTVEEEESRSRLIAHYSKLLPWIYYILDK